AAREKMLFLIRRTPQTNTGAPAAAARCDDITVALDDERVTVLRHFALRQLLHRTVTVRPPQRHDARLALVCAVQIARIVDLECAPVATRRECRKAATRIEPPYRRMKTVDEEYETVRRRNDTVRRRTRQTQCGNGRDRRNCAARRNDQRNGYGV